MKALSNMTRLQVSSEFLLLLLKVYEAKGKEFYYEKLFARDEDVFRKKVIEDNTYFVGKILNLGLTDARLKLLSKKKMIAKNKQETLLLNIKQALINMQKYPDAFELLPNEFEDLARLLAKDFEPIKFETSEEKGEGNLLSPQKKKVSHRDYLDGMMREYVKQNKTKNYELTQMISNFYVDFIYNHIFTGYNDIISYLTLYGFLLKDFAVFKYVSFFEYFYKSFENWQLALNSASYYYSTGFPNTDLINKSIVDILSKSYDKVNLLSREYTFEKTLNKSDNIEATIKKGPEIFTKDEIRQQHPTVALITIDRTLKRLKDEGMVQPLGKGRSSKWQRLDENKRKGRHQLDIFQFTDQ